MRISSILNTALFAVLMTAQAEAAVYERVLKVGTEATLAPFEFVDENSDIVGFEIDIINAIVKEQGLKIEIIDMPFDALLPAVATDQLQLSISTISITEDRKRLVDFTDSYFTTGLSFMVREEDADKYKTSQSLKGKRLCALSGTTTIGKAFEFSPGNVVVLKNQGVAVKHMLSKGCEAVISENAAILYYINQEGGDNVALIDEMLSIEFHGIAVSKDDPDLLKKLNEGIDKIKSSGVYDEIYVKWFGVKPSNNEEYLEQQAEA